jgi:lipopolysaccharide export system permease protein
MPRIIYRYILKEICLVFGISLVTFTFILLVAKIFTFTDLVVNKGVSPVVLIHLIGYKLPYFFVFTFPMSILMATLVTFLRLSHDHEITALKASGVSLTQLLPPVLMLSVFAHLITTFMAVYLIPEGNRAFKGLVDELTQQKAYVGITPRIFIDDFEGLVLYVNSVDTSGRYLENIFIADERDPGLSHAIIAQKGVVMGNAQTKAKGLALRLSDGEIHYDSKDLKNTDTVQFNTYELSLDLTQSAKSSGPGELGESEMRLKELWEEIQKVETKDVKYNMLVMEFHEKFSVPFSCLILGFIGLAIAVQSKAYGFSASVAMALGVFLVYYVLLSAAKSFGESGAIPPALGMWMPNLLLGALSTVMFVSACRERPMRSLEVLIRIAEKVKSLFPFPGGQKTP